jgi:hypothetical protein
MITLQEARTKFPLKSTVSLKRQGTQAISDLLTRATVTGYSTLPDVTGAPLVLLHVRYRDSWGRMKSYKVQAGIVEKADV